MGRRESRGKRPQQVNDCLIVVVRGIDPLQFCPQRGYRVGVTGLRKHRYHTGQLAAILEQECRVYFPAYKRRCERIGGEHDAEPLCSRQTTVDGRDDVRTRGKLSLVELYMGRPMARRSSATFSTDALSARLAQRYLTR